jgi:RNA polymerase sigma-70 factor, ECF subfamily
MEKQVLSYDERRQALLADGLLIEQIRQRDVAALGELYDRYSPLVYTVTLRITLSDAAAEELLIDVFSTAWHATEQHQRFASTAHWLLDICCRTHAAMAPLAR